MLGPVLASVHNLTFYQRLVARLRAAIVADRLAAEAAALLVDLRGEPRRADDPPG
jgi:queuine tRNA-ribosyltransferase